MQIKVLCNYSFAPNTHTVHAELYFYKTVQYGRGACQISLEPLLLQLAKGGAIAKKKC